MYQNKPSKPLFTLQESISTCRFAQRVCSVKNHIRSNWFVNSTKEILLLRREVEIMKMQNNEVITLN